MAESPPLPNSPTMQIGACASALLNRWSDTLVTQVVFAGGDVKQLLARNPRRLGIVFGVDPGMTSGLAYFPMTLSVAQATVLPKFTGYAYATCDLWKGAISGDWFGFSTFGGTVTVFELVSVF